MAFSRSPNRHALVSEGGYGVSTAPLVTAFASAVVSCARRRDSMVLNSEGDLHARFRQRVDEELGYD